jgi:hypothetical protein
MKSFLILTLLTLMVITSKGQSKSTDYVLTLSFAPSFMTSSELSIQVKGDSCIFNIFFNKSYKSQQELFETKAVPASKSKALTSFIKDYMFQPKQKLDTVGSRKPLIQGDSVTAYAINIGLDGINVYGTFNQNNVVNKFAFWSPDKGTKNAELIAIVFNLIGNAFTDQKTINYIEQLQQYFPHQLGLKKLSNNPLTYKLFGSISANEKDDLYNFLKHLPLHKKVIIDMSNYSGMGTMFYDDFNQYCANNENIFWLNPSPRGLIDLNKIGISNDQIMQEKANEINTLNSN